MGKLFERVLKKNSLKLNTAAHNNASCYTDTDGSLEHSPSRGHLHHKGPALQKIIPSEGGPPIYMHTHTHRRYVCVYIHMYTGIIFLYFYIHVCINTNISHAHISPHISSSSYFSAAPLQILRASSCSGFGCCELLADCAVQSERQHRARAQGSRKQRLFPEQALLPILTTSLFHQSLASCFNLPKL